MSGFTYESDFLGTLAQILTDLQGYRTFAYEMVQNADDAEGHGEHPAASWIRFDVRDDVVEVSNDGVFSFCGEDTARCSQSPLCNVHAFLLVAAESKRQRDETTGAFGIGFVSSYQITDHPELISAGLHLTLRPEAPELGDRVVSCEGCDHCRDQAGTVFRFPWAASGSDLRQRLGQEARHSPDELADELLGCLRDSLPFLQRLERVELRRTGKHLATFECERTDQSVRLTGPRDEVVKLHRFAGDFDAQAADLRAREDSSIEAKRRSKVEILVGADLDAGRIHATLPTDEALKAAALVSADFFPKSDRRSITLEAGTRGDWNRAALAAIARVIANNVDEFPELIGHQGTWRLIRSIYQTARDGRDGAFECFWDTLLPALDTAEITPTAAGDVVAPKDALFLPAPEDDVSGSVLDVLGAHPLAPGIREFVQPLPRTAFGMRDLSATILAALVEECSTEDLQPDELQDLWSLMDRVVGRDRGSNRAAHTEQVLGNTATAPDVDGSLTAWTNIRKSDDATTKLLRRYVYLLDSERLGGNTNLRDQLAQRFEVSLGLLDSLKEKGVTGIELQLAEWFYGRRKEWEEEDELRAAVAQLPMFPTEADGQRIFLPLGELTLPQSQTGQFVDEAGIASVLDTNSGAEVVSLAKLLGIEELTLDVYIKEHLTNALAEANATKQSPPWIADLLRTLARETSEIVGSAELKSELQKLSFVPCGARCVRPSEAVFRSDSTLVALGAEWPTYDGPVEAHGLLAEIGVSSSPQPAHIVARVEELTGDPPTPESVAGVQALLGLMAQRYSFRGQGQASALTDAVEVDYGNLLDTEWLPAEGDEECWWAPDDLFLHNRDYLFKTQGRFLDLPRADENAIVGFLEALGLRSDPPVEMVISHLRYCYDSGTPPNSQIYPELRRKVEDLSEDDIAKLSGFPSLWLADQTWALPDEVFWDEPGVGPFAKRLDAADWGSLRPLLDEMGVRQQPGGDDAMRILKELASAEGMDWQSIEAVATRCWQLLTEALASEDLRDVTVRSRLGDARCVIAGQELLRPPEVYVDDRPQLTKVLQDKLGNTLINRPEAAWLALRAAGVRAISELLAARPSYSSTSPHNVLKSVLGERRNQVARVFESALGSAQGGVAVARVVALDVVAAAGLSVRWNFVPDATIPIGPTDTRAVWVEQDERLYVAPGEFGNDLVREIAFALGADPSRLYVLKEVLAAEDADDAEKILDELSIPRLTEARDVELSETVGFAEIDEDDLAHVDDDYEDDDDEDQHEDEELNLDGDDDDGEEDADSDDDRASGVESGEEETPYGRGEAGDADPTGGHPSGSQHAGARRPQRGRPSGGWSSNGTAGTGNSNRGAPRKRRPSDPADSWQVIVSGRASSRDEYEPTPGSPQHARKLAIDAAGVEAVRRYERDRGRDPDAVELDHENPGYDVVSLDSDGNIDRYIEVKSLAGDWGDGRSFPRITPRQLEFAQGRHLDAGGNHVEPEAVWLYVVERAETEPRITPINNPIGRATRFVFDRGWRVLGEITLDESDLDEISYIVGASGIPAPAERYVPDGDPDVAFDLAWPARRVAIVSAGQDVEPPDGWTLLTLGSFDPDELLDLLQAGTDVA